MEQILRLLKCEISAGTKQKYKSTLKRAQTLRNDLKVIQVA